MSNTQKTMKYHKAFKEAYLLINDLSSFRKILNTFLEKEITYKNFIINVDFEQLKSIKDFIEFMNFYASKNIKFKFNITLESIDFILNLPNIYEV